MGKLSKMKRFRTYCLTFLPLIIFLLIWQFIISPIGKNTFLFSKPSLILQSLKENTINLVLPYDFLITGLETLLGFLLGNVIGIILGFGLWYSTKLAEISRPYIIAIGSIPIFALAPMTIMWFGTGISAKVMLATISTFTIALIQAYTGAKNTDKNQIKLLKTFGANKNQIFFRIIIPSSLTWVLSSLKLNVSFALLGAFIGEFISAENGLGFRMIKASSLYNTSLLFSALIYFLILSFIFNYTINLIEKKVLFWKEKSD